MKDDLPKAAGRFFVRLENEMFRQLALAGYNDLRPRHGAILAYLIPEGRRLTEFAELSGQHKQMIGTLADELEALGYLTRQPDPTDRRAKLLRPTPRGEAQLKEAGRIIAALEARISATIGQPRLSAMQQTLADAAAAISSH